MHLYYDCCNMPSLYRTALVETRCYLLQLFRLIEKLLYFYLPDMSNTILLIERIIHSIFLVSRYIFFFFKFASVDYFYMAQCFLPRHVYYYIAAFQHGFVLHIFFFFIYSLPGIKIFNFCRVYRQTNTIDSL